MKDLGARDLLGWWTWWNMFYLQVTCRYNGDYLSFKSMNHFVTRAVYQQRINEMGQRFTNFSCTKKGWRSLLKRQISCFPRPRCGAYLFSQQPRLFRNSLGNTATWDVDPLKPKMLTDACQKICGLFFFFFNQNCKTPLNHLLDCTVSFCFDSCTSGSLSLVGQMHKEQFPWSGILLSHGGRCRLV